MNGKMNRNNKWTVVLEITDNGCESGGGWNPIRREELDSNENLPQILQHVPGVTFRVMEVINCPYGPLPKGSGILGVKS